MDATSYNEAIHHGVSTPLLSKEENLFMRILSKIALLFALALTGTSNAYLPQTKAPATAQTDQKDWIKRSDEYAQILLKIQAKYAPEFAGRQGVPGLDEEVSQFSTERREQQKAEVKAALGQLQKALGTEEDPLVKQDLEIMIKAA